MLTPASPLFGSMSYMSQDSSCCSVLNNAVIMDEDDEETIPTDERPMLVPIDDMSPIVEKSFNMSDLAQAASGISFPNPSEDRSNSSLQDFLSHAPPTAPLDVAFIGSSPGPQWSPGIKNALKSPNPVIRIDSALNFLDSIPSASPKKKPSTSMNCTSLSLSAILPSSSRIETASPPVSPPLPDLKRIEPVEASPLRRLTHQRSGALPFVAKRISSPELSLVPPPRSVSSSIYSSSMGRKTVLTSEERELRDAEEGRRRLLAQIRVNRKNFQHLQSDSPSHINTSWRGGLNSSSSPRIRNSSVPTSRGLLRIKLSSAPPPVVHATSFLGRSRLDMTPSRIGVGSFSTTIVPRGSSAIPRSTAAIYTARRAPTLPPMRREQSVVRPAWR